MTIRPLLPAATQIMRPPQPQEVPKPAAPLPAAPVISAEKSNESDDIGETLKEMRDGTTDYLILKTMLEIQGMKVGDEEESEIEKVAAREIERGVAAGSSVAVLQVSEEGETSRAEVSVSSSRLYVTTDDLEIEFEKTTVEIEINQGPIEQGDPLALDLDGNGIQTTGVEKGVSFDINGDGKDEQTSFIAGNDAFLAVDRNDNGKIDSGKELFGDQNGDANGFAALSKLDQNNDLLIDENDDAFSNLRLMSFRSDGTQNIRTLSEAGIRAIHLDYRESNNQLNRYDYQSEISHFEREDGTSGLAADLMLGFRAKA